MERVNEYGDKWSDGWLDAIAVQCADGGTDPGPKGIKGRMKEQDSLPEETRD